MAQADRLALQLGEKGENRSGTLFIAKPKEIAHKHAQLTFSVIRKGSQADRDH